MPNETDNPVRCERVFAGTLPELLNFLSGPPAPEPASDDGNTEFLLGYLQGINALSGHLLDVFSE